MRVLLLVLAALVIDVSAADACSCVARSFAEHAKTEKLVVLARAGKPHKTGDALKQTFTVLATLKGKPAATFVLDRPATPPCAQSYAEGEVAILFTSGGELDPCHGNVPLAQQIADVPAIVAATGAKRGAAKLEAVEVALRAALMPYLHDRPAVAVGLPALAGKALQLGKSKLRFAARAGAKGIAISQAFTVGDVAFVAGKYGVEGVTFSVLLHFDNGWKVVGDSVAET